MFECAIEILKIIDKKGFKAYIVGGYVRDIYLSRNSTDIDICTDATPKELVKIFKRNIKIDEEYGSVKLLYKNNYYDITTFRKDIKYKDNRHPSKIEYVKDLKEDLNRRDFTINSLCMDKDGNIIDLLDVKKDISNKIIKTILDPNKTIQEDSLRILRAVRFASTLNFSISKDLEKAIKKYKKNLFELSFHHKKSELNKIFRSENYEYGISLINKYKLNKELGLSKLNKIKKTSDVLGMWAQIDYSSEYPFSKLEVETINKIREILSYKKIDEYILYRYGNYIPLTVCEILGIEKKNILTMYDNLPIKSSKDINITIIDIANLLGIDPSKKTRDIMRNIELNIIYGKIENKYEILKEYVIKEYGGKNER